MIPLFAQDVIPGAGNRLTALKSKKEIKIELVSVVFDRKKRVETIGEGKVETCIYLSRTERKFITITTCNAISWKKYEKSKELRDKVMAYKHIVYNMLKNGEEMTIASGERLARNP